MNSCRPAPRMENRDAAPAAQELAYPGEFHFRILTETATHAETALAARIAAYRVTSPLAVSRDSSTGRYRAFCVSVRLEDREEHLRLDAEIKQVPGVRLVL
jgi:putative lipoic acid-binding regulatory protein